MLVQIAFGMALVGNTLLWVSFLNRSHGLGIWRWVAHCCSLLSLIGASGGPFVIAAAFAMTWPNSLPPVPNWFTSYVTAVSESAVWQLPAIYTGLCVVLGAILITMWLASRCSLRTPAQLLNESTTRLSLGPREDEPSWSRGVWKFATMLSANEIFRLDMTEKTLALPNLPARLEGLSIAHLSDLHMSGRIAAGYFRDVVERTNEAKPDLVAITGDIVDAASCLAWLSETLGKLVAPYGVYYVLGNHDRKVDVQALRAVLDDAGLVNLGGRCRRLTVDGESLLLAGNELPWIRPAPDMALWRDDNASLLRVLLSHSPDQISWARRHKFDLMLAGHTHGGQIQFPLLGPVLAPSVYGTKYACGTFYEAPTLMHVSRGVSGLTPVRYHCPPEVALLRLTGDPSRRSGRGSTSETRKEYATWT
ncbi:MAG TPA: metallophosphoesterase [Pirellulales bacterium]